MNKVLSTPKAVLEAMARSISPGIYKSFTARYTKDIALEVGSKRTVDPRPGKGGGILERGEGVVCCGVV